MALFYRKANCHAGLFPRNGELFARKVIVGSLCGRAALNSGKVALGARDIQTGKYSIKSLGWQSNTAQILSRASIGRCFTVPVQIAEIVDGLIPVISANSF